MRLRDTHWAIALRGASRVGRRVVLVCEVVTISAVAATAAWASTSPGSGSLAITCLVALAAAAALVGVASLTIPGDAPLAPSWWTKQRQGIVTT